MDKLVRTIETIRAKLGSLRKRSLKETPTRIIIVDPLLDALGWDVRDPDEVQLEYPTVDNKSVDYALKINGKPVLLVEAKALDDPLSDVKAITQVVGYAANDGIVWCVLTNGVKWKVYRSVEKCPAPDKLMYELSLDPDESEEISLQDLSHQMWRISRDEMAKGTLDALGEQTFTDGKIRKALDAIMLDPPRALLNLVRKASGDSNLRPKKIRESLVRIWSKPGLEIQGARTPLPKDEGAHLKSAVKTSQTRRRLHGGRPYDENDHLQGKPQEVVELYRAIDRLCLSLTIGGVEKYFLAKTINYLHGKRIFCCVHVLQSGLRVWLKLKHSRIENPPSFSRDVSSVGHWGAGDLELAVTSLAQLDQVNRLVRQSFEAR